MVVSLHHEIKTITTMFEFVSLPAAKKLTGLGYIGKVNNSYKHEKAYSYNEMVYSIYLAPADMSGYDVCPGRNNECTALCLNESGRNRRNMRSEFINRSRITKTQLFFEDHEFFCRWVVAEITLAKARAKRMGFEFSVRLNNTSDISPEQFYITENGVKKNVLQLFPDVTFYDYTKISSRFLLTKIYPNYDLTYSFNGYNWRMCEKMLENGIRVAAVFESELPETYKGYKVIDADFYDMRYRDAKNVICGLHFKKVRNTLYPDNKFVIQVKNEVFELV